MLGHTLFPRQDLRVKGWWNRLLRRQRLLTVRVGWDPRMRAFFMSVIDITDARHALLTEQSFAEVDDAIGAVSMYAVIHESLREALAFDRSASFGGRLPHALI